ncbi:MAG: hypothetical protein LBI42_08390 [Chitinispirillales bacterium]|jgi:hypothetical protein|nr:hypothetical protein [Chitinispirillales bacterium]
MNELGRESKDENDLFFVCSVIEYIGRKTKNRRSAVVEKIGGKEIARTLELADVLHCEPVENTGDGLIEKYHITKGDFDNVAKCEYNVPTHFDIAKVYKRLIWAVSGAKGISAADALKEVYGSWISAKIDDYNSSMYFENPQYLYESYRAQKPIGE